MYELIALKNDSFYVQSPSNVGIYRVGGEAILIDGGNSPDAAKKALKSVAELGLSLRAVIATHHHADHIGGCALLQERTGCKVYCGKEAMGFLTHPKLNAGILFSAEPPKELRSKFFLAKPSTCEDIELAPLPEGMEILRLDGHSVGQFGVKTPDNVWYLGDSVSGERVLDKYTVSYLYDVRAFLESLDKLEIIEGDFFLPAHDTHTDDIRPLVRKNREKVFEVMEKVLSVCKEPATFENILRRLFIDYGMQMSVSQYALIGATLRAYLTYLSDEEKLVAEPGEGELLWRAV